MLQEALSDVIDSGVIGDYGRIVPTLEALLSDARDDATRERLEQLLADMTQLACQFSNAVH
jgi:hypothetical protein